MFKKIFLISSFLFFASFYIHATKMKDNFDKKTPSQTKGGKIIPFHKIKDSSRKSQDGHEIPSYIYYKEQIIKFLLNYFDTDLAQKK